MKRLAEATIETCDRAFATLATKVPPPTIVPLRTRGHVFRYTEKTAAQAVIQKLARVITSLRAVDRLLSAGLYQEVGVIYRVLDELSEDVIFLCQALRTGEITPMQSEYLESFYMEEFDNPDDLMGSHRSRPTMSRKKIHAALAAMPENPLNSSDASKVYTILTKVFSGYVHAASGHILELYGGQPPRYHTDGMLGTPRQIEHEGHARQYFHRGLVTVMYAAVSMREDALVQSLYKFRDAFEKAAGMTEWPDPDKQVRNIRTNGA